jgi:uncharacterized membrane protein
MTFKLRGGRLHDIQLSVGMAAVFASLAAGVFAPAGWLALAVFSTLPGIFILQILRLGRKLSWGERVALTPILSLAVLMIAGLTTNQLLPFLNVTNRPLDPLPALLSTSAVTLGLGLASWRLNQRRNYTFNLPAITQKRVALAAGLGVLPLLAAAGAITLNNFGPPLLQILFYTLVAIVPAILIAWRHRLPAGFWAWAVFCLGLGLLWSTSLRGWHITGHDIQLEYFVYTITAEAGRWSMSHFQDPYNACLSITILPTLFKNLAGVDATWLFKLVYQAVFALSATLTYYLARRFTTPAVAFMSAMLFMTFPTFIIDMPFLGRQELAFAFFSALMLILFTKRLSQGTHLALVILLGIGMVLSHYSTTFTTILLFGGVWAASLLWRRFGRRWDRGINRQNLPIRLATIIVLLVVSITWTGLFTKTSSNVTNAVDTITDFATNGFTNRTADDNSGYALLKYAKPSQQDVLDQYVKDQKVIMAATAAGSGGYYPNAGDYKLLASNEPTQPFTGLGKWLKDRGLEPKFIINDVKQFYSYAVQVLLVVGTVVVFLSRKRLGISTNYLLLIPVGVGLLALQVFVPSLEYGLLRMFQQILYFAGPIIILAGLEIFGWYKSLAKYAHVIIMSMIGVLFLFLSGVVGAVTGGTNGTLQLSNSGFYHDAYYTTDSDIAAFKWLTSNAQSGYPVFTDSFSRMRLRTITGEVTLDNLTPTAISRDSYVLMNGANVTKDRVALYYHGQLLYYEYPRPFLDSTKDLLYSSDRNQVWR